MSLKTFFGIGEANAEVVRLTNELTKVTSERDAAQTRVTELEATNGTLQGQVTVLTGERDGARAELATAQTTITAKDQEIAGLKATATSVETRAAEIAATVGSKAAIGADPGASGKTKSEEYLELQAKDPTAAGKFFAEHRDAILAGR